MSYPFLVIRKRGDGVLVRGQRSAKVGYAAYAAVGEHEPYSMHGWWQWDGQSLTAAVDRFGLFNLYYHATNDTFMISSSPLQLIAEGAPSAVDERAIVLFYRLGMCMGEDTPFAQIKVLPRAGSLHWRPGKLTVDSQPLRFPPREMTRREALEGFIELFRVSVRKCVERCPHPLVVPLSGGRDSRHILLAMEHAGVRPHACATVNGFVGIDDPEVIAARGVCETMGIEHTVLNGCHSQQWRRMRTLVHGHLCTDEHTQLMPLADWFRGKPWVIMDGLAGDTLSRSRPLQPEPVALYAKGDWLGFAERMMSNHERVVGGRLEAWLGPEAGELYPRDQAVAHLAEYLPQFAQDAEPLHAFEFAHRTRRELSLIGSAIYSQTAGVLCPYAYPPLVEFLLSLPASITQDGMLHDEAIALGYPRYAQLPFDYQLPRGRSRRLGPIRRARALAEHIRQMGRLGRGLALAELCAQGRLLRRRHYRKLDAYRLHRLCMKLANDAAGARRLMDVTEARQGLSGPPTPTAAPRLATTAETSISE